MLSQAVMAGNLRILLCYMTLISLLPLQPSATKQCSTSEAQKLTQETLATLGNLIFSLFHTTEAIGNGRLISNNISQLSKNNHSESQTKYSSWAQLENGGSDHLFRPISHQGIWTEHQKAVMKFISIAIFFYRATATLWLPRSHTLPLNLMSRRSALMAMVRQLEVGL